MNKAWIYQDSHQLAKKGTDLTSWSCGWIDPDGKRRCKSFGPGARGKQAAGRFKEKTEAELLTRTYKQENRKVWQQFRTDYQAKILDGMKPQSRRLVNDALDAFQRIIKPVKMASIRTQTIDTFVAQRRKEPGKQSGSLLSLATVNKELRHLRAAFRKAFKWGWLPVLPDFAFLREPKKLPSYVKPEHFATMYAACGVAELPSGKPYSAADWWRGLLSMAYMTGWRISELLALKRTDLDLEAGTAITRHGDNKGCRDEIVKLHPVVVEHLKRLASFDPNVFPWDGSERCLYRQFSGIQEQAGIHLGCPLEHLPEHKHTRYCHVYGFHDLRRAFATMNASKLSADALQSLMRHQSYVTTQRYINMATQLDTAVDLLHVPDVLKQQATA